MLRHAFTDAALLERALTHRSASPGQSNERLEFLGDAVLGLIAGELLYSHWPTADEGQLSRGRTELVRESALAGIARGLGLGNHLRLGPGEIRSGGFRRDSTLADALEAVLGAIYLDGGLAAAQSEAQAWLQPLIEALPAPGALAKDAKTRLQEWLQARGHPLPVYALIDELGPEHARIFIVTCALNPRNGAEALTARAEGPSRRSAEQAAAAEILAQLPQ